MMNKKSALSKWILYSLLTASIVGINGTVLGADPQELGPQYGTNSEISNGTITASQPTGNEGSAAIALYNAGQNLKATNVTVNSGYIRVKAGNTLEMINSKVNASPYLIDGKAVSDQGVYVDNGTATFTNTPVNGSISIGTEGGTDPNKIIFNNSDINNKTAYGHGAFFVNGTNSTAVLNGTKDNTYTPDEFIGGVAGGKIYLNGGVLQADNLRAVTNGSLLQPTSTNGEDGLTQDTVDYIKSNITKGGIVLQQDGVIRTKADQIFAKGIDTTSEKTAANSKDSGAVTNSYIDYQGGTLQFNDKWYTQEYLDSAKQNMNTYGGKSTIVMLGDLVDENGVAKEEISIDDAVKNGDKIYTKQIVTTDKDVTTLHLNGGSGVVAGVQSAGSFNAAKLKVDAKTNAITIDTGKKLGLATNEDGELVYGNDAKLTVTNKGTLQLGQAGLTTNATKSTLSADVVNDGALDVAVGKHTIDGNVTVGNNGTVKVNQNGSLTVTGDLTANQATLTVGGDTAGTLIAKNADFTDSTTTISSAADSKNIQNSAKAAISYKDNALTGTTNVGVNGVLSVGTADTNKAEQAFAETGLTWGKDAVSAVYLGDSLNVAKGTLTAGDGTNGSAVGEVSLGKNAVLLVDGTALKDKAAIDGATTVTIAQNTKDATDGAKLYIDNAEDGTYTIAKANTVTGSFDAGNIISNISLLKFTQDTSDTSALKVTADFQNVADVYGKNAVVIDKVVDKTVQKAGDKSKDKAFQFFKNAVNSNINTTKASQANALNSVANMGELGGVTRSTYGMSNTLTDSVADHLSLATHDQTQRDVWAKYVHTKDDVSDVDLGGLQGNYDGKYNGVVIGSDLYTNDNTTVGAAFTYVSGDITGNTQTAYTKNDADYYGASLYGRVKNGSSAILGDISYLHGSNDVTQYNSDTTITASPDTAAFSIGVRAEKEYAAGQSGKIVPYAGLRYMRLSTDDYTNNLGLHYNVEDQNLFFIPVGIRYTSDIQNNDWTIRPVLELGYVWNTGDKNTNQTVSLNGGANTFSFDTTDSGSFVGKLGVQAENDTWAYGLGYAYQKGSTVKSNQWAANVTFKF